MVLLCFLVVCASIAVRAFYKRHTTEVPPNILLWSGERVRNHKSSNVIMNVETLKTIEIAVAFCKADLDWIRNVVKHELPTHSNIKITILSKCGNDNDVSSFFNGIPNVSLDLVKLPNKGGCDLAYAHFINRYMIRENAQTAASSVILFLKDTPRTNKNCHQRGTYREIKKMVEVSSHGHFICGVKPECMMSSFHDTRILKSFAKESYVRHGDDEKSASDFNPEKYKNLGDFVARELDWSFPNNQVAEVCYGGTFAVPASRFFVDERSRSNFERIEQILMEGPSMSVVEHFAERLWGSLLSNPLSQNEIEAILGLRQMIDTEQGRYMGTLMSYSTENC